MLSQPGSGLQTFVAPAGTTVAAPPSATAAKQTLATSKQAAGGSQRGAANAAESSSESEDSDESGSKAAVVELLDAEESTVYSNGTMVVSLPMDLRPRTMIRVRYPCGTVRDMRVPSDAISGQLLPVGTAGGAFPGKSAHWRVQNTQADMLGSRGARRRCGIR